MKKVSPNPADAVRVWRCRRLAEPLRYRAGLGHFLPLHSPHTNGTSSAKSTAQRRFAR
ncbi:hypothethical protein (plasmid) [Ralstonia solanacearum CMR15]|nr:hypothethical protein [Ralstonia solanacearum CMR15]